jgi:hypothetical protein
MDVTAVTGGSPGNGRAGGLEQLQSGEQLAAGGRIERLEGRC